MNITLRQLRAFVTLAETASFTRAAEHLHITRPALSGTIKELESSLGVPVFHRSTRRVLLSDIGAEFLPLATRILQDLEQALGTITELKALRAGIVRVAAPQLIASALMPQVLRVFADQYAEVELRLVDCVPNSVLAKVRSGEVDLAIGGEREPVPDVQAHMLFESPSVAVLPSDHVLARGRGPIHWKTLAQHRLISLTGEYRELLNSALHAAGGPQLRPRIEVEYLSTAISLVAAGTGVTTCPLFAAPTARLYGLRVRALVEPRIVRRFYLFTRKDRLLSPAAQAFADCLVAYTADLPAKA